MWSTWTKSSTSTCAKTQPENLSSSRVILQNYSECTWVSPYFTKTGFCSKKYGNVGNGVYTSERTWHVCFWCDSPQWTRASSFTRFLDHIQRRTTDGRTPLDEWSARRRDLYLTIHNTYNRHTSMPSVGFEPTISAGERQLEPATWHVPVNISNGRASI